jgi:hypothetical protein
MLQNLFSKKAHTYMQYINHRVTRDLNIFPWEFPKIYLHALIHDSRGNPGGKFPYEKKILFESI